jgi:hypothetical protein
MAKVAPEFTIDEALYLLSAVVKAAESDPHVQMAVSKLEHGILDAACEDPSELIASHERTQLHTMDFFPKNGRKV